MAFCSNCGVKLADGAKFCASCGTAVVQAPAAVTPADTGEPEEDLFAFINDDNDSPAADAPAITEKKQKKSTGNGRISETQGTLRKNCPSCGQSIESFQTRCPSCGHELNPTEVSKHYKEFVDKLDRIANTGKKITHEKLPGKDGDSDYQWNVVDNLQRQWILNHVLPTTKEDLLELLIFVAGKVKPSPQSLYEETWNRIWKSKSKQIYAKARLCLKTDPAVIKSIEEILAENGIK